MPLRSKTHRARRLRHSATDAERRLWFRLRTLVLPWKIRRQHPIGPYVVDFACPARKLAIELDGGQHAVQLEKDKARTEELARLGYRVIRFWNHDVLTNTDGVSEAIVRALESAPPLPDPLRPPGRRGRILRSV